MTPVPEEKIRDFLELFPDTPDHLIRLFRVIGEADLADHGYFLWFGATADGVHAHVDGATDERLIVVGHSCTGASEAYDSANGWRFGKIDECNYWWPDESPDRTFIDFLEDRCLKAI
jgi:hypothetical protein